jgi:Reverse transcriptase (RNA-dependent DNA polymerase)
VKLGAVVLDEALAHIVSRGDTDVLPHAQEFLAIQAQWAFVRAELEKIELDTWSSRPLRQFLSPKRSLSFRIATQLDPLDCILLTALVLEIGSDLEATRLSISSKSVFSYRFNTNTTGQLYDPSITYESFRKRSLEIAEEDEGFVVQTDIADFFARLYQHRLENALAAATVKQDHVRALTKMLSGFTQSDSHGVPIGPAVVRLLSEVAIGDVDEALLGEGYKFVRFSDDYRIFVQTKADARKAIAFLAKTLHRHHGLTLQESKTRIYAAAEFVSHESKTEEDEERRLLASNYSGFLQSLRERQVADADFDQQAEDPDVFVLGFLGEYEDVAYDDLNVEEKDFVDSLNLWEILEEQFGGDEAIDVALCRFALKRIVQLRLTGEYKLLLKNLERTYTFFPDIVSALAMHANVETSLRAQIADALLELIDDPIVGHLEYHRAWILSVFNTKDWNHEAELQKLYERFSDELTRPQVVYALGACGVTHWFRGKKADVLNMAPWERRAFLAGVSCLPKDEVRHWVKSITPRLDLLEKAVAKNAVGSS